MIGRHPDELGCLSLIYAVTKKYAAAQNKFKVGDLERQLWKKLREKKIEMIEQLTLDLYAACIFLACIRRVFFTYQKRRSREESKLRSFR